MRKCASLMWLRKRWAWRRATSRAGVGSWKSMCRRAVGVCRAENTSQDVADGFATGWQISGSIVHVCCASSHLCAEQGGFITPDAG